MLPRLNSFTFRLAIGFALFLTGHSQCPSPNGYFADPHQCDKYTSCTDGVATEKLCPDGLIFNSNSPLYERCDLPYIASCGVRTLLQEPQPSIHCPRKNGLFSHEDPTKCGHFWSCEKGKANLLNCPEGLAFRESTGGCEWPDVARGCNAEGQRTTKIRADPVIVDTHDTTNGTAGEISNPTPSDDGNVRRPLQGTRRGTLRRRPVTPQ